MASFQSMATLAANASLPECTTRILIAEDNIVNQRVALAFLQKLGYEADVVPNGLLVLSALEHTSYDIIFMDLRMPEMGGLEAARHIIKRFKPAPYIIALTASAMEDDRMDCLMAGMQDFLPKPFTPEDLVDALARYARAVIVTS